MRNGPLILSILLVVAGSPSAPPLCAETGVGKVAAETLGVTVEYAQAPVVYSSTVVATLKSGGKPVKGRTVTFKVVKGPHLGWPTVTQTTDSKGQARSTYQGDGNLGSDSVFVQAASSDPEIGADVMQPAAGPWVECSVKWRQEPSCGDLAGADPWLWIMCAVAMGAKNFGSSCSGGSYAAVGQQSLPVSVEAEVEILQLMRAYRDKVLSQDSVGRHLTELWYRHSPELTEIGLESPALFVAAHDLVHANRGTLEEIVQQGQGRIQASELERLRAILEQFAERASPGLRETILEVEEMVKDPQTVLALGVKVE